MCIMCLINRHCPSVESVEKNCVCEFRELANSPRPPLYSAIIVLPGFTKITDMTFWFQKESSMITGSYEISLTLLYEC